MCAWNPKANDIFLKAIEIGPDEARRGFLDRACGGNVELRGQVESLLAARERAGSFLEAPAPGLVASEAQADSDEVRLVRAAHDEVAALVTELKGGAPHEGPGSLVGPYRLLERIGEGGFGTVYLAEQKEPVRRKVAIKVIKLGMDTRQVIARFEAERQALAMMDHPHIAKVLDAGTTPSPLQGEGGGEGLSAGRPYFVMELVKGVPITQYCDDQRVPLRERLALFSDVCLAVQHAHQKGIIHRDLKPSNVLVSRHDDKPVVKVIDFGIVKATGGRLTEKTIHTEWRQLIGTPAYMSPEQAGMSDLDVDTRSDIYALGVLLYELLTGTPPFDPEQLLSAGFDEMRRIIREVEPPRPSTRVSSLGLSPSPFKGEGRGEGAAREGIPATVGARKDSRTSGSSVLDIARMRRTDPQALSRSLRGELDWIVMKCLEKDRTRRYETANGLALEVERYLKNEPVLAGPPGRLYRFRKFAHRNRAIVTAAAVVALSLLAGMAGTTFGLLRAEERRVEAVQSQDRERQQRELAEKREEQTQKVSDFQAAMLSEIDVEAMGRGIKQRLREQVRAALERQYVGEFPDRRKRTPEEIEAELAAFDQRADAAQAVDVARGVMDEFVLARAADALEKEFADQPLVRAQLRAAIGSTYQNLGAYDAAEPHLRAALEIRSRELGSEHVLVADGLSDLGVLLLDKGDYAAAEPLLREALAMRQKILGDEHPAVAAALHNLAGLLAATKDFFEAEPLYRKALAMRRKLLGDEDPAVVWTLKNLGDMLTDKGDYPTAEPLLHEALAGARKLWGDQHPDTANTLSAVAKLRDYKGDYSAESMFRDVLAIYRKAYGDEHPYVADGLGNVASALTTKGDYAAAEPLFREALAIRRRVLGDEHPNVGLNLRMLATALERQDKCAAGEPFCREMLELARKKPADNVNLAASLARLGLNLIRQRSFAEAELLLRECVAIREKALAPDSPDYWQLANARSMLGGALVGQGAALLESDAPAAIAKFTEAEPLLIEAGGWLTQNADRIPEQYRAERLRETLERIVRLYESWDAAEPDSGRAQQAAEWRAALQEPPGP